MHIYGSDDRSEALHRGFTGTRDILTVLGLLAVASPVRTGYRGLTVRRDEWPSKLEMRVQDSIVSQHSC